MNRRSFLGTSLAIMAAPAIAKYEWLMKPRLILPNGPRAIYVQETAPFFGDGSSWSVPLKNFADAVAIARRGDTIHVYDTKFVSSVSIPQGVNGYFDACRFAANVSPLFTLIGS